MCWGVVPKHLKIQKSKQVTWQSDPFELLAVNGYLYGRGVTDNKGPIMAMIFALQVGYYIKDRLMDGLMDGWMD